MRRKALGQNSDGESSQRTETDGRGFVCSGTVLKAEINKKMQTLSRTVSNHKTIRCFRNTTIVLETNVNVGFRRSLTFG